MRDAPHIEPLNRYAADLRASAPATRVPDFDPRDGGIDATLLFLLEKPGPALARNETAPAIVSRDNPTGTARAIAAFMLEAGIPRERTVLWNVVPWWNGTTRITAAEHRDGQKALEGLLPLLPRLRAAVTVGRRAEAARPLLEAHGLPVIASAHPSPQVRASRPKLWAEIPDRWREAAALAGLALPERATRSQP